MSLSIRQFPCLADNYGYLIRDEASGLTAAVDTPDADAVMADLAASGWKRLDFILNTHWHPDHAGGNARLQALTGCRILGPGEVRRIAPLDQEVVDGEVFDLGETRFQVIHAPGHTLGHVVWLAADEGEAFVGDVLFAMGCGRLFEGDAAMMWSSLLRLAALPDRTRVWCAHEYTASNARFALSVDDDPAVVARAQQVFAARDRGRPTVPTTIGLEKATNPFLRAGGVERFAALRAAKDGFSG